MYHVDSDDDKYDTAGREGGYVVMKLPELSNDVFNVLLNMLNSAGIKYASPKERGKETHRSTSTEGPMGRNPDFDTGLVSTLETMAQVLKMRRSVVATHYKCCSSCLTLLHTQCTL